MTLKELLEGFYRGRKFIDPENITCSHDRTFVQGEEGLEVQQTPKQYHLGKKSGVGGRGLLEFMASVIGMYSRPMQMYLTKRRLKELNAGIKKQ